MKENKVVITITKDEFKTELTLNGKNYVEHHKRTGNGSAKCISGDFQDEADIPEDLYEELTSFTAFNIMNELNNATSPDTTQSPNLKANK